ncbi:MAG: hypothetical protein MK226_17670 [Saprospiraceae bacterium]|nr:hypothetical protein [Saprospiraceae bacterium]
MKQEWLDLLIYSMDHPLTPEEQKTLDEALSLSDALKKEQEQLLAVRNLLLQNTPPASPIFVENVIAKLARPQQPKLTTIIVDLYPQIAAACVLFIAVALSAIYVSEGSLTYDALVGVNELSFGDANTLIDY